MKTRTIDQILPNVPPAASSYCIWLTDNYSFEFKLRKSRVTKVGDFMAQRGKRPQITVNSDLAPHLFLITFVHELAHLDVFLRFGHKVESHGGEWKAAFQKLMAPLMNSEIFPGDILEVLHRHMINPKASSFSDSELTAVLRKYDSKQMNVVLLSELAEGALFTFNGRWFKRGKIRRTRVECRDMNSKRKYLVPADAPVENAQLSLL